MKTEEEGGLLQAKEKGSEEMSSPDILISKS